MEKNLLLKEAEFYKLNEQLEIKTQELLKEVEGVMQIQDRLTKKNKNVDSNQQRIAEGKLQVVDPYFHKRSSSSSSDDLTNIATVSLNDVKRKLSNNSRASRRLRGYSRSELPHLNTARVPNPVQTFSLPDEIGEDILPESSLAMGTEGLVRFLKAKVKAMQEELDSLHADYKKRTEEWRKQQMEMKQVEEDRNKSHQLVTSLKDSLKKQELLNSNTTSKLAEQETENANLRKELETLKKEVKAVLQTSSSNEARLNRSLDELEKLKSVLQNYKREDKEQRDLTRRKGDEMAAIVKRLERQKMELLMGFKKQMQLIDNLKKQKTHLKAACLIQFSETEFLKLLDWCPVTPQTHDM